jgi:hypothetical protein
METMNPIMARTDLVTSTRPTLLKDSSQALDPTLGPYLQLCKDVSSIQTSRVFQRQQKMGILMEDSMGWRA